VILVSYLASLSAILDRVNATQSDRIGKAADQMASSIVGGGLVHLFGSGHSVIPVLEAFPRYGSYVGFHPLTDPRLMWSNVLGPGGVRELLWLEREEGYVANYLRNQPIGAGDTVLVYSHGGLNAAPIEAATYATSANARVVAITALANAVREATHSSGHRLSDVADIVIDTCVPARDALVDVEGWGAPVGGASTVVASAVTQTLVTETAIRLAAAGMRMPTFVSPMADVGDSGPINDDVFNAYARRVQEAHARRLT
jgi:uncharacterized phosphosugar-binding protein